MSDIKLVFLAGSVRKESYNLLLAKYAHKLTKKIDANIDATFVNLADYDMPIYNGDEEDTSGMPKNAIRLKKELHNSDGIFLASPEYNGFFSPLIKNTFDWLSRPGPKHVADFTPFKEKIVAISAASPGARGGVRGLETLRLLLNNLHANVIDTQVSIPSAFEAFDDNGQLKNASQKDELTEVVNQLISATKASKST